VPLGTSKSTVSFDLARSGIRASELCDLRIGHVRLHDPGGWRFRISDRRKRVET
jgi:hypothetical protein